MRKAPKESATKFKVGTVMRGQDDLSYYVLKDKNNRKRWVKGSTLFVVYNYVYEKNKDLDGQNINMRVVGFMLVQEELAI